jgi:hypothetical protein
MPRRLTISIQADGTVAAEASGTPGPDCLDSLDQLRAILNAEVAGSKPTPEFSGVSVTRIELGTAHTTHQEEGNHA